MLNIFFCNLKLDKSDVSSKQKWFVALKIMPAQNLIVKLIVSMEFDILAIIQRYCLCK